jgi:hypothetical protein
MPASRKEKDSTNHLEHRSINHPAGPKYLKDLALEFPRHGLSGDYAVSNAAMCSA